MSLSWFPIIPTYWDHPVCISIIIMWDLICIYLRSKTAGLESSGVTCTDTPCHGHSPGSWNQGCRAGTQASGVGWWQQWFPVRRIAEVIFLSWKCLIFWRQLYNNSVGKGPTEETDIGIHLHMGFFYMIALYFSLRFSHQFTFLFIPLNLGVTP